MPAIPQHSWLNNYLFCAHGGNVRDPVPLHGPAVCDRAVVAWAGLTSCPVVLAPAGRARGGHWPLRWCAVRRVAYSHYVAGVPFPGPRCAIGADKTRWCVAWQRQQQRCGCWRSLVVGRRCGRLLAWRRVLTWAAHCLSTLHWLRLDWPDSVQRCSGGRVAVTGWAGRRNACCCVLPAARPCGRRFRTGCDCSVRVLWRIVYRLFRQTKGTQSFGMRHNKTHVVCRRCGKTTLHVQKGTCSSCGFPAAKIRSCEFPS